MSSDRFRTLFTLVPASTSTSYIVTVGPRWLARTRAADAERLERPLERGPRVLLVAGVAGRAGARRSRSSGGRRVPAAARAHRQADLLRLVDLHRVRFGLGLRYAGVRGGRRSAPCGGARPGPPGRRGGRRAVRGRPENYDRWRQSDLRGAVNVQSDDSIKLRSCRSRRWNRRRNSSRSPFLPAATMENQKT